MAHTRPSTPSGHGELLCRPPFGDWAGLARSNNKAARGWSFEVGGVPAVEIRRLARAEAVSAAREFSARLGVPVAEVAEDPDLLVVTGHQPEMYHPGVWVKDFLLQRLSDETGAAAIDVVVDSDAFDAVQIHSPCMQPEVQVCRQYLALGGPDVCYACSSPPDAEALEGFVEAVGTQISTLPAPAVSHHFETFAACLRTAAADADDLAELVTFARRRYEAEAGTDYLELPLTRLAQGRAYGTFVRAIAADAQRFAECYNGELTAYRERTGTRSSAQPVPDLRRDGDLIELPFWLLDGMRRRSVWARGGPSPQIVCDGEVIAALEPGGASDELLPGGRTLAPKALMLTMFVRTFLADLFVHGVGGGRYDRVTDGVIERFFGIAPLPFVVASLTMYLPLGARVVGDEEIEALVQRANRLKANPDQMLGEVEFDDLAERDRARGLAEEKGSLTEAIAATGADKKALGLRIRAVNEELADMLSPYAGELAAELQRLRQLREASEVLTDRTYPLCFWSPLEVADKVR